MSTTSPIGLQTIPQTTIFLSPQPGDNLPQIQAAVDFCKNNAGYDICLLPGSYPTSAPILIANVVNGDYREVTIRVRGIAFAKNTPLAFTSCILPQFNDAPAIIIQKGKSCEIKNISSTGCYGLPNSLNPLQVYTMPFDQWDDGACTMGRTNPHCFIAIDPFSRPDYYDGVLYKMYGPVKQLYLLNMSRSGSTGIKIIGCQVNNYPIGIVVSPSWQENGDLIDIVDCRIDYCRSSTAWTQAQSKQNNVRDLMVWGNVHTVLDGANYGYWRGDGNIAPRVSGISIAGAVHQLIQTNTYAFPTHIEKVYGEGLFSIGSIGTNPFCATSFTDIDVDFVNDAGMPSPDYWFQGPYTKWINCNLRLYSENHFRRFIFNSRRNVFTGGSIGLPPYCVNDQGQAPTFDGVRMFYGKDWLCTSDYDETIHAGQGLIKINPDYTGSFETGQPEQFKTDDLLVTMETNVNGGIKNFVSFSPNNQATLGYISRVEGDTVYLDHIGVSIKNGVQYPIYIARIKAGFNY